MKTRPGDTVGASSFAVLDSHIKSLLRKETIMSKLVLSARFVRLMFIGLLMLSAIPARSVSPPAPYKISGIKAMLFYDGKGTFSRDVLAKPDFSFWNTIIGEGDAAGPLT